MKLQRISITGFRSFRTTQVLLLNKMYPGLWLVTGENEVEPELGANGAGKSSLFEAVHWALYGKTSRSLKDQDRYVDKNPIPKLIDLGWRGH